MNTVNGELQSTKKYLSVKDAACYLSVSQSTLKRLLYDKAIPCARVRDGGKIIIAVKDLDQWFEKNRCFMSFMIDFGSLPKIQSN